MLPNRTVLLVLFLALTISNIVSFIPSRLTIERSLDSTNARSDSQISGISINNRLSSPLDSKNVVSNKIGGPAINDGKAHLVATVDPKSPKGIVSQSFPTSQSLSHYGSNVQPAIPRTIDSPRLTPNGLSIPSAVSGFDGPPGNPPPEPSVAVGPSQVVETVNKFQMVVFSRNGTVMLDVPLSVLFNLTYAGIGDPRVLYDTSSRRFFASEIPALPNFRVAVSAPDDATGTWKVYEFNSGTAEADQPLLGISDDKVVVSTNAYTAKPGSVFLGAQFWVLNKSELISGKPTIDMLVKGPLSNRESIHPVISLSSTTALYMVSTGGEDINNTDFHYYSVTGAPPGIVTIKEIPLSISPIRTRILARQPDTFTPFLNTDDHRVESAAWYKGTLWFAANDGCIPAGDNQTRSCFRLTQIDTSVSPNVVRQDFDVGTRGLYLFYPALTMDDESNLAVIYGFSSATNSTCCFPSLGATGRAVTDPLGTLRGSLLIRQGTHAQPGYGSPVARYGDYYGAATDPSDPSMLWFAGEYNNQSTAITSLRINDFALWANPGFVSITSGSSENSTITATTLKSGFNITLTITSSTPSLNVSLGATTITPAARISGASLLSITSTPNTPSGLYLINVTATGAGHAHSFIVNVIVSRSLVCIANPLNFARCPFGLGAMFNGPLTSSPTQLKVGVFADGSPAFQSFDITLLADHTILSPVNVDIAGNILEAAGYNYCIGGTGTYCVTTDTTDTVHVTLVGQTSHWPTTGFLFAVTYDIVGSTDGTVISFQTGCTNTSIQGGECVTLYNQGFIVPEFLKTASFVTHTSPLVSLSANPSSLGPVLQSGTASTTITAGSLNQYPNGNDTGEVTFTAFSSAASFAFTPNPILLPRGQSTNTLLSITPSQSGNYTFTLFATYSVTNATGCSSACVTTLATRIILTITVQAIRISSNPSSLRITAGSTGSFTITLSSVNGFAGQVNLTSAVSPIGSGLSTSLSPTTATLSRGGSTSITFTVSTTSYTPAQSYTVTVKALTGIGSTLRSLTINVAGFAILANPGSLTINAGSTGTSTLSITSQNSFTATVTLTPTSSPNGLPVSLGQYSLKLAANSSNSTTLTVSPNVPSGNYTVTITASTGSLIHSVVVAIRVANIGISANPTSLVIYYPSTKTSQITLKSINGFAGTVSLSYTTETGEVGGTFNPATLNLVSGGTATSTMTVGAFAKGYDIIHVTANSSILFVTANVTVTIRCGTVCPQIINDPHSTSTGRVETGNATIEVSTEDGSIFSLGSGVVATTMRNVYATKISLNHSTFPKSIDPEQFKEHGMEGIGLGPTKR